jgi:hypothetical protein
MMDMQDAIREIDIANCQKPGLRNSETTQVDHAEKHRHDQMPERTVIAAMAFISLGKKAFQFIVRVDVWNIPGRAQVIPFGYDICCHANRYKV